MGGRNRLSSVRFASACALGENFCSAVLASGESRSPATKLNEEQVLFKQVQSAMQQSSVACESDVCAEVTAIVW